MSGKQRGIFFIIISSNHKSNIHSIKMCQICLWTIWSLSWIVTGTARNGYGKVLYFSKHYTHLQNILHGIETRICTSLQKQYVICIKQYVHVFSLWSFVQQQTQSNKKKIFMEWMPHFIWFTSYGFTYT